MEAAFIPVPGAAHPGSFQREFGPLGIDHSRIRKKLQQVAGRLREPSGFRARKDAVGASGFFSKVRMGGRKASLPTPI